MREVLAQGTTLLFVSHDLATVEATCTRGIWLDKGVMIAQGSTPEVMAAYRESVEADAALTTSRSGDFEILEAEVSGAQGSLPETAGPLEIRLVVSKQADDPDSWTNVVIGVTEGTATPIFVLRHRAELKDGIAEVRCQIPYLPLPRGRFFVWATVGQKLKDTAKSIAWQPVAKFDVVGRDLDPTPQAVVRLSPVYVDSNWSITPSNGHRPVDAVEGIPGAGSFEGERSALER
jgi:ABC-2 type transport system ATP-binding protein